MQRFKYRFLIFCLVLAVSSAKVKTGLSILSLTDSLLLILYYTMHMFYTPTPLEC